ncbi:MAG: BatD family protein [Thermodesulfobacteriota bacterium]|nr:BatD family protein [Thermodesulfobacteriota bacterium]
MKRAMLSNREKGSLQELGVITQPGIAHGQIRPKRPLWLFRLVLSTFGFEPSALFLLLSSLVFIILPCAANGAVSVTMQLDRKEATLADSVKMIISVAGARESDSKPAVHGLETFHVTGGGTSSRLEIINGQVSAGIDFTYLIQPKRTGTFEIGPAEITIDGRVVRSNKKTLKISPPSRTSGAAQGPLFLTATLSPNQVYVEEQTIYTLKLFRQTRVSDISLALPEQEHLSFKQLGKPLEYQSVHGGQSYQVLEVRFAVTASSEGPYSIRPSTMNLTVYQPRTRSRRTPFDDPFFSFSAGRPMALSSEPVKVKVLPLPVQGRPADFSGLVGTFQLESKLEPTEIRAGESATLTVLLKGLGNVHRLPDLEMPELDHTKVYADQPVLEVETDQQGMGGSKTMKWALVPEKEGLYHIPPLTVSFFDTKSRQYRSIGTSPFSFSVLPGQEKERAVAADFERGETTKGPVKLAVKELGRDILPVHTSVKDMEPALGVGPQGLLPWILLTAPFVVYGVAFCGKRLRKDSDKASALAKAKKAAGVLIKKCRKGELSSGDLGEAIRGYLNDRLGLSLGSLTPREAFEILQSRGVRPASSQRLQAFLQRLEDDVYSGKGQDVCHMGEDLPTLIKEIDKQIR